jgi:hypothetical protein
MARRQTRLRYRRRKSRRAVIMKDEGLFQSSFRRHRKNFPIGSRKKML